MILIVSSFDDVHALVVAKAIRDRGFEVEIGDVREFGAGALLRVEPRNPAASTWTRVDGTTIELGRVHTVWCRRMFPPRYDAGVRDLGDREFMQRQWSEALWGTVASLDARLISDPYAQRAATKPYQLAIAHRLGLRTPESVVTNDQSAVEAFLARHDQRVIHKILAVSYEHFLYTKQWEEEDRTALADLELAPMIFQDLVGGSKELRVTIIGTKVFAAVFRPDGHVDGRLDSTAVYEPYTMEDSVSAKLLQLMERLHLRYATLDLKLDDSGEPVFLDLNPQGQYLYIEIRTGQPMTEALVELLAAPLLTRGERVPASERRL